jgi:hypothetical protein
MSEIELIESAVSEYRDLLASVKGTGVEGPGMDRLVRDLLRAHDWTERGAREIVSLANEYGAFMLRNALAVALALDKEDDDLGF